MKLVLSFVYYRPYAQLMYQILSEQTACQVGVVFHNRSRPAQWPASISTATAPDVVSGVGWLRRALNWQVDVPTYLRGLAAALRSQQATHVFVCDVYHWYGLQALRYCRRNPHTKLFIISETKRWPASRVSRWVLRGFFWFWRRRQSRLAGVLVYNQASEEFITAQLPAVPVTRIFAPVQAPELPLKTDWLPGGVLRIIMNARYVPFKRHADLFAAVQRLQSQGVRCAVSCIGLADAGRKTVEELAAAYNVATVVSFLDPLPQAALTDLYRAHDVLVLPSYNEAIGMVVPEAMAAGIPTITSDTVGANTYVAPNETGIIFPTGDVDALAAALTRCTNPETVQQMGRAAYVRMQTVFSPSAFAQCFDKLVRHG